MRASYESLGLGLMSNLPGTLNEVEDIKKIINNAEIITDKGATENKVKALSNNGELANYKVIHFATHGLVVPEIPELSALVLSQIVEGQNEEDGFLNMREISKLKLHADFVNLSACETGLGKLYAGEGVVGLMQSFLIAGANGLSVSLWQVADKSTAEFMVAIYALVEEKSMDYPMAITEIKRLFINGDFGDKYKSPFYWAPFVYYGKQ